MADFDLELPTRLSRLAAAVPVARGQLDPVHRGAVAARQRIRMAWLTPLVFIVIVAVLTTMLGIGPFAPGATSTPGPVALDRQGAFALQLRAGKSHYEPGEAIDVVASLLFDGPAASVTFKHDSHGPIVFGIQERVFGEIQVGEISLLMWDQTTLARNEPLSQPFQKGGAFDGEHPDAERLKAWLLDPVLRLPEGTWHLFARASGSTLADDDEASLFNLSTEIEIVVDDPATTGHPSATEWADKPVYGGDDVGNMIFQVKSTHPSYAVGTPIDLDTYYWFSEGPPLATSPFVQSTVFQIVQVDPAATVIRDIGPAQNCTETTMGAGEERHVPIQDEHVALIKAVSWPQSAADALEHGILDLPVGRWRLTAVVRAEFGPCGNPHETWEVHASVEVDVLQHP